MKYILVLLLLSCASCATHQPITLTPHHEAQLEIIKAEYKGYCTDLDEKTIRYLIEEGLTSAKCREYFCDCLTEVRIDLTRQRWIETGDTSPDSIWDMMKNGWTAMSPCMKKAAKIN